MTAHVVGAGIAGLSAAMALLDAGVEVRVHEAAPTPGGRCRSYHDPSLDRRIDTGTHLLLGANPRALGYLARLRALDRMVEGKPAAYPFVDVASGRRWTVRPPVRGLFPALRPIALAVFNTDPSDIPWRSLARLFVRLTSERACRPWIARDGIGAAMVDPAAARLGDRLGCGRRLTAIETDGDRVRTLVFGAERIALGAEDRVILALPPAAASGLLPGLVVPTETRAIVNAHFRIDDTAPTPRLIGVTGGLAQWILWRDDVVSVTVSAADRLLAEAAEPLAAHLWAEVSRVLDLRGPLPAFRVVKERRATIAATAASERLRPPARTPFRSLVLAGDWTRTGLPATLESAVRSGEAAARLALARD